MTLKLNRDLDILKLCLQTENEVVRSSHSKYIYPELKKYEKKLSRSKVSNFQPFLALPVGHISTKLHRFLTSSCRDFLRTDSQTHRQTPSKTIPAGNLHAGNKQINVIQYEPAERAAKKEQRSFAGWFPVHPSQSASMTSDVASEAATVDISSVSSVSVLSVVYAQ